MKAALVTGGARRIGRAIVEDLAAHGFAVAIHANGSFGEAEALAAGLSAAGAKAVALQADLTDVTAASGLIAQATARLGPLDLLVNNASVFNKDSLEQFDEGVWERHFALHVKAPSLLARDFARQRPGDVSGLIVNVIGPGPTLPNERQDPRDFEAQVNALILRRGPALDEFGRAIRFLFDTPSVTGQMIALDGGQHLAWETPDIREIVE